MEPLSDLKGNGWLARVQKGNDHANRDLIAGFRSLVRGMSGLVRLLKQGGPWVFSSAPMLLTALWLFHGKNRFAVSLIDHALPILIIIMRREDESISSFLFSLFLNFPKRRSIPPLEYSAHSRRRGSNAT